MTKVDGFFALNRLKTSPMASTRALPNSRKLRETRRLNCVRHAPRPQFQVSQAPMSFGASPTPVNWYARSGMSLRLLSRFRSRAVGDRHRQRRPER